MKQEFSCVINTENPYLLQVGEMLVEMKYAEQSKKIEECVLNILKLKIGK